MLYLLELAYYTQELPMLFVWFTKRKDFGQMVAHHVATLGLIAYSLELGWVLLAVLLFVCVVRAVCVGCRVCACRVCRCVHICIAYMC